MSSIVRDNAISLSNSHISGGHFLQTAINRYFATIPSSTDTTTTHSTEDAGKQALNILTLVAELYNFQVVGCLLIYDLIRGFIDDLTEAGEGAKKDFAVEGLLKLLRCRYFFFCLTCLR